jgi:hypothetical protein
MHPSTPPPPIPDRQRAGDSDHLNLLAVFHFVIAGLSLVGIAFLFLHYTMMHTFLDNPLLWQNQRQPAPPREFFAMFDVMYVFFGAVFLSAGVLNLISGFCLRARKQRVFSLVIAGLDCLQLPFGTVLGVFTIIVLLRPSVREIYEGPLA